jgi:hypothetical protein
MTHVDARLNNIAIARRTILESGGAANTGYLDGWIERSWKRCLTNGHQPHTAVEFAQISSQDLRRVDVANHELVHAAKPMMDKLGRAIASTQYFAILTNAEGIVIDSNGPVDQADKRARLISRIGVDYPKKRLVLLLLARFWLSYNPFGCIVENTFSMTTRLLVVRDRPCLDHVASASVC